MAGPMKHCLVLDGSTSARTMARRILEDLDFEVTEAEDGSRALEICAASMPSVIFIDDETPILSGVVFLASLRAAGGSERPVAVFCARDRDARKIERAMQAGADGYLFKPYDQAVVAAKLQEIGLI